MNKLKAIGVIRHRVDPDYPSFEVATYRNEYQYGSSFLVGVRADTGGTYSVMAASCVFEEYKNIDDDGMNKESEIIDELIEDERHDCDKPEVTEWKAGEKPPCGVWLDCIGSRSDIVIDVVKFFYLGDKWSIAHSKLDTGIETPIAWKQYSYRIHIDPKEKALAEIAFALATKVIGEDAAKEINFNRDNEFSCDYRNMAQAIIDGCIGHVEYTGGK
ncbi:hypothetical protein LQT17_01150 [Escherichia coli]|uniref:hypothetical protein n=1 Tax=Escherichia coli TaxID=562 RepID=UPI0017503A0B|nr:hypothetical protein LQT17_01150 [Escherichia coli]UVY20699.1 MAG: hypothetical protein [Bacteriophage sp.]HAG8745691.1 hypothetical protein [Escherichia coli]HCP1852252.1 hypothetical protein [Escherichia coli]